MEFRSNRCRFDAVIRVGVPAALSLAVALSCLLPSPTANAGVQPPCLNCPTPSPGGQNPIARTYQIQGTATIGYDMSLSAAGSYLDNCDVPVVPQYSFSFSGTLDTPSQTISGALPVRFAPSTIDDPNTWPDWDYQCGPLARDGSGTLLTDPNGNNFRTKFVHYFYSYAQQTTPLSGYYELKSGSSYTGTFHLSAQVTLVGTARFDTCNVNGKRVDCSSIYHDSSGQGKAPILLNIPLVIDGSINFIPPDSGNGPMIVQMLGSVNLQGTNWPCCLSHSQTSDALIGGTPQSP
jgi:hypothetical protein